MSSIDITFTKLPTPAQIVSKASGMMSLSKARVDRIGVHYKDESIIMEKDKVDKTWQISGKMCGYTDDQLIDALNT